MFWVIPPVEPVGPKNAEQLPWRTVGPGPGHCTPFEAVFPTCVQPAKLPASNPPLVIRFAATAGSAPPIARPNAADAATAFKERTAHSAVFFICHYPPMFEDLLFRLPTTFEAITVHR